ncbi:GPI-anchored protein pfl2 [Biomphalaria pfeifferi]|uniref:GPI-anchored protein pfl2 n=1 Tax=Biomphalaria pfeifferi TaxID=112525 RepID=A0AAD8B6B6_BIOPF|nr:GPI-anchored protein pfl2 [Biomphalaria pfeifferi]
MKLSNIGSEAKRADGDGDLPVSISESVKSDIKNVAITPLKAPMEIKNALRRQRRMFGINYAPPPTAQSTLAKPTYRAVLPEAFQPSCTRYTITTSHSLTGDTPKGEEPNYIVTRVTDNVGSRGGVVYEKRLESASIASSKNADIARAAGNLPRATLSTNKFKQTPENYETLASPRSNAPDTSSKYHNSFRLNGFQKMAMAPKDVSDLHHVSKTLPPGFRVKAPIESNNLFGFSRSQTSDRLTLRNHDNNVVRRMSYDDDLGLHRVIRKDYVSFDQGRRGKVHFSFPPPIRLHDAVDSSRGGYLDVTSRVDPKTVSEISALSKQETSEPIDETQNHSGKFSAVSSMDLADSIIKAVNENINEVYQLCQTKVKYSDFIEKTQPHRLSSNETQWNGAEIKLKENALNEPTSKKNNQTKSALTFPKRTNLLPNLQLRQRGMSTLLQESDARSILNHLHDSDSKEDQALVSMSALPEPEIDYDKPITIIIECNREGSLKSTRPILKQTSKSNNGFGNFEKPRDGDLNNNKLTQLSFALGTQNVVEHGTKPDVDAATDSRSVHKKYQPESNELTLGKGRLVRFNADPKIHEFAPTDPVLSPK